MKRVRELNKEIQEIYKRDNRPWIIGYSGGKDSTTTLQLIWNGLAELPEMERQKPVYVISSDTLVETPVIVSYIDTNLARINEASAKQKLPFQAHKVQPAIDDSFWINLIGKGYPAPSNKFRWCTERLKIDPANKFILDRVAKHGEVVVVLGVRKSESATRAQVMSLHEVAGSDLRRHSSLPNAYVFTPIEDFSVDDVWNYLLQVKSPWGSNNRDLVTMYRNAQAGECPLVVDKTTASCGNSRFGCWVCTVVQQDHSMESMVENGEDWMEAMLDFRNWLAGTQDPARKAEFRSFKRRSGKITIDKKTGTPIPGPYHLHVRKEILKKLLQAEKFVQENGPDSSQQLIVDAELREIRKLWRLDAQDWSDSIVEIVKENSSRKISWEHDDFGSFGAPEREILDKIASAEDISSAMLARLLDSERSWQGLGRRSGIFKEIDKILGEDWLNSADEAGLAKRYLEKRGIVDEEQSDEVETAQ